MSLSHSGTYMDGVPVKISEKYKPPPQITLPYGVLEQANVSADVLATANYDFSLEKNVLVKLTEWRNAKDTIKNERNHRLQLKEEARQRELDLKAATETEETLKKLSVSEVSYPSTEEISEISPDEGEDFKTSEVPQVGYPSALSAAANSVDNFVENIPGNVYQYGSQVGAYTNPTPIDKTRSDTSYDILQPTPVSPSRTCPPTNLLDDPDPILLIQKNIHYRPKARPFTHNNLDNLTFSDFENDTSSPFDNMELKTINDLELLAQVLTNQQACVNLGNNCAETPVQQEAALASGYSIPHSIAGNMMSSYIPCSAYESPASHPGDSHTHTYSIPNSYIPMSNGYYNPNPSNKVATYSNAALPNGYYAPEYNYSVSNVMYHQVPSTIETINSQSVHHREASEQNLEFESDKYQRDNLPFNHNIGKNHYDYYNTSSNNYSFYPSVAFPSYSPIQPLPAQPDPARVEGETSLAILKSRSKSVPDIVKELDEEVAEARLRSHNCSPAPASSVGARPQVVRPQLPPSTSQKLSENLSDPFYNLSPSLQVMCQHISGMGFPLDRVARACDEVGKDDKKIVEYLLAMGQLLDLGFPESKVAKALLQHNCNRDKALDELVS